MACSSAWKQGVSSTGHTRVNDPPSASRSRWVSKPIATMRSSAKRHSRIDARQGNALKALKCLLFRLGRKKVAAAAFEIGAYTTGCATRRRANRRIRLVWSGNHQRTELFPHGRPLDMGIDLIEAFSFELRFQFHQVTTGAASREFEGAFQDVFLLHWARP
jgi:hypothetical protein